MKTLCFFVIIIYYGICWIYYNFYLKSPLINLLFCLSSSVVERQAENLKVIGSVPFSSNSLFLVFLVFFFNLKFLNWSFYFFSNFEAALLLFYFLLFLLFIFSCDNVFFFDFKLKSLPLKKFKIQPQFYFWKPIFKKTSYYGLFLSNSNNKSKKLFF